MHAHPSVEEPRLRSPPARRALAGLSAQQHHRHRLSADDKLRGVEERRGGEEGRGEERREDRSGGRGGERRGEERGQEERKRGKERQGREGKSKGRQERETGEEKRIGPEGAGVEMWPLALCKKCCLAVNSCSNLTASRSLLRAKTQ